MSRVLMALAPAMSSGRKCRPACRLATKVWCSELMSTGGTGGQRWGWGWTRGVNSEGRDGCESLGGALTGTYRCLGYRSATIDMPPLQQQ